MTLDYCYRLPKWQAVKHRSLRYGRMGNSRKYPYYTMDGFYILTPPPLPMDFLNASSPHALKIPGSLTFFRLDICLFKSVFKEYTCVCPRWKFQIYLPHHALGVPIVSIPLPPPPSPHAFAFPALSSEFL